MFMILFYLTVLFIKHAILIPHDTNCAYGTAVRLSRHGADLRGQFPTTPSRQPLLPGLRDERTGGVEGTALYETSSPTLVPPGRCVNGYAKLVITR